jgi:Family of unknown function (DUF6527)
MKSEIALVYEFVEFIPDELKERTLYISITYCTAVHKCCCGCGREIVTPLSPTGWELTFDGKTVSLYPSIGSWSLPCQSHYFITKGRAIWARKWTEKQIAKGRVEEARVKQRYYAETHPSMAAAEVPNAKPKKLSPKATKSDRNK